MSIEFKRRKTDTDEHTHISDDYEKNTFIPPFNADQARRLSDEKRALMEAQSRDVIEESKRRTMADLEAITAASEDEMRERQLKAEKDQIATQQSLGNRGLETLIKQSQAPSFVELMTQRGIQRDKEREQEQQHRNEEESHRQAEEARMRQERASAQHRNMYDDLTPFEKLMMQRAKESDKSEFDS